MSNTRHAKPGAPMSQERFASSSQFEQGLIGNLVARRCALLECAKTRELIWWIQWRSHLPGGLSKVAEELAKQAKVKFGPESLHHLPDEHVCDDDETSRFRAFLDSDDDNDDLTGAYYGNFPTMAEQKQKPLCAAGTIRRFTAGDFRAAYFTKIKSCLKERLMEFCLDPGCDAVPLDFTRFPDPNRSALPALFQMKADWENRMDPKFVATTVAREMQACLEFTASSGFALIDGLERIGKTTAAREWCNRNAGKARYVAVPATNDDAAFFRAIAKALGVSSALSMKSLQMRERCEQVLQSEKLMLVFDQAEWLWPQNNRREALPNRLNWIMSAAVEAGAPVALVSTPQFSQDQKIVSRKTLWRSERFQLLLSGRYYQLPPTLSREDLAAVARLRLPEASAKAIESIVLYAEISKSYLASVEAISGRARFLAQREGRQEASPKDISRALAENADCENARVRVFGEPATAVPTRRATMAQEMECERIRSGFVSPPTGAAPDLDEQFPASRPLVGVAHRRSTELNPAEIGV